MRVLIMAGGTGGHIFPALAVADELRAKGAEIIWMGTKQGMESDVVPKAGIEIDWISMSGIRGKGLSGWLKAPFKVMKAISEAVSIVRKRKPDVVLGMGGFAAGPGGVAAWLTGTPLLVHEQNSIAGMTNKALSLFARKIMIAFPGAFVGKKVVDVGNPLRGNILKVDAPEKRFAGRTDELRLLVIGGSLGAVALNKTVPEALGQLPDSIRTSIWHQTGKRNLEETQVFYKDAGVEARVVPFIDDMAEAYSWADIVICRAGALTVAELAAVGVGSILVPFPHAVDDHQTTNAKYLVDNDAAVCIQQNDFDASTLAAILTDYTHNRAKLLMMANAARQLARPDATLRVAALCMEVANV